MFDGLTTFLAGGSGAGMFGLSGTESKGNESSSTQTATDAVTDVTRFDKFGKKKLDELVSLLSGRVGNAGKFTKGNAISDAAGVVDNIFRQYRDQALPEIFSAESQTGGYSTTGAQFLANDAFGEATARSAQATLENIRGYEDLRLQRMGVNLQGLINALQLEAQATEKTNVDAEESAFTQSFGRSRALGAEAKFGSGGG